MPKESESFNNDKNPTDMITYSQNSEVEEVLISDEELGECGSLSYETRLNEKLRGLQEDEFSFCDIAERFGWNVSTVHDCWEQWSRDQEDQVPGCHVSLLRWCNGVAHSTLGGLTHNTR
ncbi:hypothetical protein TNCV_172451 [Trichonephila clavipes]|nr:hypothetical protein TNCV_172451 [Trichonephila clavipes]